jgi:hypothetical protein
MKLTYYYIIMNQKDLFNNHVLEELLREKSNYYHTNKQQKDFWIINSPKFLEEQNLFQRIKNSNFSKNSSYNSYFSCLISTDQKYIRWIELRLGYFETLKDLEKLNTRKFSSDGLVGSFIFDESGKVSILENSSSRIDPLILAKEFSFINNALEKYSL